MSGNDNVIQIGAWQFNANKKQLTHRESGQLVKLEDKISSLLQFLYEHRGSIVSKTDLIEAIWDGRELSEQTIPVAISKLRKALDDDINHPSILATIPRQGYKLLAEDSAISKTENNNNNKEKFAIPQVITAVIAIVFAGFIVWWLPDTSQQNDLIVKLAQAPKPGIIVTVNDVRTNAQTKEMMPQAIGTSELISYFLSQSADVQVVRHWWNLDAPDPTGGVYTRYGERTPIYSLKPNLIMDAGRPVVTLVLSDPKNDEVIWSGLHSTDAGSDDLSRQLSAMLSTLGAEASSIEQTKEQDVRYWNARYFANLSSKGAAYNAASIIQDIAQKPDVSPEVQFLAAGLKARWQATETDTDAFSSLKSLDSGLLDDNLVNSATHTQLADFAAIALYRDNDFDTAEHLLEKALDKAPGDHHSLFLLGETYALSGRPSAAKDAYKRAYRLAPFARVYQTKLDALAQSAVPNGSE